MQTEYFHVLSSILSPSALLLEVNLRYSLHCVECKLWSMGLNDVYQLATQEKKYYLRVSHAIRFLRKDYEEEITIILNLQKNQINTCNPIQQMDGSYLWKIKALEGERYAVLFDEVPQDDTMDLYEMGKMVANIHEASDSYCFKLSRESIEYNQLIDEPLKTVSESKLLKAELLEEIRWKSNELWKWITDYIPKSIPYYGYCHGDIHSGNLYFYKNKPRIFDFDCMGYGYRAYELAVYLWDELSVNDQFMSSKQWESYLQGYDAVRRLTKAERNSFPAFAALRQVWFMGLMINTTKINNSWDGINQRFLEEQYQRFEFLYQLFKTHL